ncbi:Plastocyanin-like protein [Corchorus capsularis]|uniref:Plastocyanin-like protein n=1 Tax=Corchorus capsularis TaxID=210143 RepID=A0A1R3G8E4_COCAP|nr:Plastocyanin-like protein [Corchorus capsularis]
MARFMCMAFVGIIAVALMQCAAAQTVHVVGDNLGWTVPSTGASAYSTWAGNKRFVVGDTLVFNFGTNEHDVVQVPKASFDACSDDNKIGDVITTGPANMTLSATGEQYYICTIGRHCLAGQKLAITVVATADSPLPSPSPTTPTTPSPATDACAPEAGPTASTTPSGSSPAGTNAPATPNSSSSAVFASLLLSISAVVMGLIF